MFKSIAFPLSLCLVLLSAAVPSYSAGPAVVTYQYSNSRIGANTQETILTQTNVNVATFGKKFSYNVDGYIYAQPLYVPSLTINGAVHNVVYVVTENNSIYAFDADGGGQLWHHFIDTPVPCTPIHGCGVAPALGITSTPVIDLSLGRIYVEGRTAPKSGGYFHGLHALDITTGNEVPGSPVVISASVKGSGYDHDANGNINFNPTTENNRSALLELNGVIYVAFASLGDADPYHGWILGYDAKTLQQLYVFCVTPNGGRGGIWGGALASDGKYIYASVGNGTWDGNASQDWGNSYLKLAPSGSTLAVVDYFTPFNVQTLNNEDLDLGSAMAPLLPWLSGPYPHEMVGAGKEGRIYVVNRDSMGNFNPNSDNIIQEIPNALGQHTTHTFERSYSTPAYWGGWVYFIGTDDNVRSFKVSSGLWTTTPTAISPQTYPFPGANPTISANGLTNGILWAVQRGSPAVLRAYKANNVGHELYDTTQNATRDGIPELMPKFNPPLVVNGKVYVGTTTRLIVYGLQ